MKTVMMIEQKELGNKDTVYSSLPSSLVIFYPVNCYYDVM